MRKAWVEAGKIRDLCDGDPQELFHPDIAGYYNTTVPDFVVTGATWSGTQWENPPPPPPPPSAAVPIPLIGPIAFQMLFHVEELVASDAAKETDPVVRIFWNLLNDPRTDTVDRNLKTVQDGLHYLEAKGLIGVGRAQEILTGEVAK